MENKRFEVSCGDLWDNHNEEMLMMDFERDCVPRIVELLNELNDENQALKERRHEDINDLSVIAMKYKALEEENKKLKAELQGIYDVSTVNKVKSIVNEIYDDLLYEVADESDYARKKVLQCLEKIDDFGDGLND